MAGIEQGTFTATGQSTRCKCGCKNCQRVYETNRSLEHFAYSTPHLFSFSWFWTYGESSWWCRAPLVCSNSSQIAAWMFLQEPHATSLQSALVVVVAAAAAKSDSSALLGAHLLPICHKQIKGWCSSVERDRWRSCTLDEAELNTAASVFFHATALFFVFVFFYTTWISRTKFHIQIWVGQVGGRGKNLHGLALLVKFHLHKLPVNDPPCCATVGVLAQGYFLSAVHGSSFLIWCLKVNVSFIAAGIADLYVPDW